MLNTYTVKEIQSILKVAKSTAYRLVTSGAFPVIRIGRTYRIPADSFHKWLNQ